MLKPPAAQDVLMIQKLVITMKQELQAEMCELRDGFSMGMSAVKAGMASMESRLQLHLDQLIKQQFATMFEQMNASLDTRLSEPLVASAGGDRRGLSEKRQQSLPKSLHRQRSRSTGRGPRQEESPRKDRGLESLPPVPIRVARFDETTTADSSPRRQGDWDRDDTSFVE
mmetsp:Transcript_124637/g.285500  ORF Transcript_124637/g.285500 Transcript_124637/m.285500 type:complete len:170 (+) Transcript_124637:183-692(+)